MKLKIPIIIIIVIITGLSGFKGFQFFTFHSMYICSNTSAIRRDKDIFGFVYHSDVVENDVSLWVRSKRPEIKHDWVFSQGSGGSIVCALGRSVSRPWLLSLLYKDKDNQKVDEWLNRLLQGEDNPDPDMAVQMLDDMAIDLNYTPESGPHD